MADQDPSARQAAALAAVDQQIEIARAAIAGPWHTGEIAPHLVDDVVYGTSPISSNRIVQVCNLEMAWEKKANAAHIVANDPVTVIKQWEGRRRILQRHAPVRQTVRLLFSDTLTVDEWICASCGKRWEDCADWLDAAAGLPDETETARTDAGPHSQRGSDQHIPVGDQEEST